MRTFLCLLQSILSAALIFGSAPANATTYTYIGNPLTEFAGLCDAANCGTGLTGFVTFNFDTSHFSGTLSLSAVDTAGLNTPLSGSLSGFNLSFPGQTTWYNPPDNTYGFSEGISVGNFTLVNGSITEWLFGGDSGQVGCGGGPGCAIGSSTTVTTSTFDSSDAFTYDILANSSASNDGGGFWNQNLASAVPEPSTWAMIIFGFAGIGAMTYRRRKVAMLAA